MNDELTFHALVPIYLDALHSEGKSPKTIIAYEESLKRYMRMAPANGLPARVDEVTPTDVYRFLAAIRRTGVSDATQHRRHRELKHFFSWLRRMDIISENAFQKVPLVRLEQQIIRPITVDEIEKMLAILDPETCLGARDRALTLFLLDTGVRASEVGALNYEDLDLGLGRARILHGKGRKQRVVAFGPSVRQALEQYFRFRGERSGPLFQTNHGDPMTGPRLNHLFGSLSRRAGVSHVHPHRFRHTFATMAVRAAAREIDVQHLLGHSTSAMVRRYTRTYDSENAALAHASFSPAAQVRTGLRFDEEGPNEATALESAG